MAWIFSGCFFSFTRCTIFCFSTLIFCTIDTYGYAYMYTHISSYLGCTQMNVFTNFFDLLVITYYKLHLIDNNYNRSITYLLRIQNFYFKYMLLDLYFFQYFVYMRMERLLRTSYTMTLRSNNKNEVRQTTNFYLVELKTQYCQHIKLKCLQHNYLSKPTRVVWRTRQCSSRIK